MLKFNKNENKGKRIKMQENKNLNIDKEKKLFYKTYEYRNLKALKIFLGFTREKGRNSFEIAKHLEKDFPELIQGYKIYSFSYKNRNCFRKYKPNIYWKFYIIL